MAAALALAARGRGRTGSNPNVGCLIVKDGRIVGRGWTQDGGRPHAEAMALATADAEGSTAYVTLEPCAHLSDRGPACADSLIAARIARCVIAVQDPDPRTAGQGIARLEAANIAVSLSARNAAARHELAGFTSRLQSSRPSLTLKLALSLDGRIAMHNGTSQWITGETARTYVHVLRAEADMIVVGGGTLRADAPGLGIRLAGSSAPQPIRAAITSGSVPEGWLGMPSVAALDEIAVRLGVNRILCEGGGHLASTLLAAGRVDRMILLRAPILIGAGSGLDTLVPESLAGTHNQWQLTDRRPLDPDLLEIYSRR